MAKIGRNEPCPCGSGRKYKRCCLGKDDAADPGEETQRLHALDRRMIEDIIAWAHVKEPDAMESALRLNTIGREPGDGFEDVWESALAMVVAPGGVSLARLFLAKRERGLDALEREWLRASLDAWVGLWQIGEVRPGQGVAVRDLMTGEARDVTDIGLSNSASRHGVMCGRVVDFHGFSLFTTVHPVLLRPTQAQEVIARYLLDGDEELPWDPDALRGEAAYDLLLCWHECCQEFASSPLPSLQNTDGHVLQEITDTFEVAAGRGAECAARLEALEGIERSESSGDAQVFVWLRGGGETILGFLRMRGDVLVAETNSTERADALRARLEGLLGERIAHRGRDIKDMQDFLASAVGRSGGAREFEPPAGPEIDALIRSHKERIYASWPDEQIPALGGMTPRAASRDPVLRPRLVALLDELEMLEQQAPPGQRYDPDILRGELGLLG